MIDLIVISFGYGHGLPPEADVVGDVRLRFRDPHPELRDLDATSQRVIDRVMNTPGARPYVAALYALAETLLILDRPEGQPVVVAAGCVGGRHRAPVIANETAKLAREYGWKVEVQHRDMHRKVIRRGRLVNLWRRLVRTLAS